MHPLQAVGEAAGQHSQQGLVFGSERSAFSQLDPDDEHSVRMLDGDAGPAGFLGVDDEQFTAGQCADRVPRSGWQIGPLHGFTDANQFRPVGWRGRGRGRVGSASAEGDGQYPACVPQPMQFLGRGTHRVIDGVGLDELLVECG